MRFKQKYLRSLVRYLAVAVDMVSVMPALSFFTGTALACQQALASVSAQSRLIVPKKMIPVSAILTGESRRIFSRFEKLASRYFAFVNLVSALIWLRWNVNRT